MKNLSFFLLLCCSMCLVSPLNAQNLLGKSGAKAWDSMLQKVMPSSFKNTLLLHTHRPTAVTLPRPFTGARSAYGALAFSRAMLQETATKKPLLAAPQLQPFEQYAKHFIFTVSARGEKDPFKASGFVFAETNDKETVLWGFSAAHAVRYMGKEVEVTFYAEGKEYTFPAEIVLTGRKFGLNAALIKLPPAVAQVALPVIPAQELPQQKDLLFTFGFSAGKYKKTVRQTIYPGTERIVATFSAYNPPKPGFCGSVVLNNRGEAVGIEVGGYSPKKDNLYWYRRRHQLQKIPRDNVAYISEIVPFSRALDLVRQYRHPGTAKRLMIFNGIKVGYLEPDEFIESIGVRYQNASSVRIPRNPFVSLDELHAPFKLANAVQAEILINKNRTETIGYLVNLNTKQVFKIGPEK